jgi:hypothetical protein
VLADRRCQRNERQHNNQPDKRYKRGAMRGSSAIKRCRHRRMGGGSVTRGDTKNSRGRQEASSPEKKRGTTRGGNRIRGGQMEAPPDGRWQRIIGNMTTSQGRQEA